MAARILALTLHSGENELPACKHSLAEQTLPPAEHVVLSGLGNVEAHRALYATIMKRADEFDLFLKIDADMVVSRPTALAEVAALFAREPELDHIQVAVYDHFTDALIPGVHVFSGRVRWPSLHAGDRLFVDASPRYPGRFLNDPPGLAPFIDHAPDPSPYQAFHYGYHRALKLYQPARRWKNPMRAKRFLRVLDRVERHHAARPGERLALVLEAAELVRQGRLTGVTGDKDDEAVRLAFARLQGLRGARRWTGGWIQRLDPAAFPLRLAWEIYGTALLRSLSPCLRSNPPSS